jgi:hypothetical protein
MTKNTIEDELDAIRLELYEETKDMTSTERVAYIKAQVAPTLKKFGIRTLNEKKGDELLQKEVVSL